LNVLGHPKKSRCEIIPRKKVRTERKITFPSPGPNPAAGAACRKKFLAALQKVVRGLDSGS